ncbi:TPA: AAA family ATPase [Candidatus Dependentiae bacterium]|nr:MAG: AAA+ superfamily protein [candidate division TM6 bacterium GW2011_GWF2_36_131]KKQ02549.1 MAG: AAA+ superfamily protein [candidate division TM6 bacterium GW2011_GWE2_36_25]KKQ19304.1 MAG: AAA+ superfamily protein [candidate division TM6 bacterium GW2011_GWA2_36_9]HBR70923.1 AAA family ATPase [Candidatus Dependentiae bacterium]HCU00429.1 AAA family ATPase [Candidatus Dependentiae bacterium]
MFKRKLADILKKRASKIPVLAVVGPRQSGKTTLVRDVFKKHAYVSLETFEDRELARTDPRRFFESLDNKHGIIIDEVQRVPELMSYMQTLVDAEYRPGYFILTGSQNIMLNQAISQTLAGRITILTLLPLSIAEMRTNKLLPQTIEELTWKGFYPRIYAQDLDSVSWYLDYIETYVERDVRQIINITQLSTFRRFIRLCAGRIGQLLNIASLATDCGIDQRTAKAWISVLEASYILFLLQPYHGNFNKRLIKSPKMYFYDSGLVCSLLDIQSTAQLNDHYLRGNIIESMIISDIIKFYYNAGERPHHVNFWRDQTGNEVDCIIHKDGKLVPVEIKASKTIVSDFFKGLDFFTNLSTEKVKIGKGSIIYGGSKNQEREQGTVVSWKDTDRIFK